MEYSHRYPAYPDSEVEVAIESQIDIHRQGYNYALYEYNNVNAANIGSAYKHHDRLTDWKEKFDVFSEVNSKALQRTVTRLYQNESSLDELEANGHDVGALKWKSPGEHFRGGASGLKERT
ncbi:MAG: putative transposase [Natronomonas sp.]|jgi:putative transposase